MTLTYASQIYNTTAMNSERGDSYHVHCTGSCWASSSVLFWVIHQLYLAGCPLSPASFPSQGF